MKTHLIKKQTIEQYVRGNIQSKSAFSFWLSILKWAQWKEPNDIISTFNSADILGKSSERVVFNIGGNKYRMICSYHFGKKKFICLSSGLEHIRNIQNCVTKENNIP